MNIITLFIFIEKIIVVFYLYLINTNFELIFIHNFYVFTDYFLLNWISEFLTEIILILYILYNLISLFNDTNKSIFQYYRSILIYTLIFLSLLGKIFSYNWITQILLGFSWINCFYTIWSKLIIIFLTILVLIISKNKLKNSEHLTCIIEFPLILSFSLLFMFLLTSSYDFFGMYLAIEGLSLTLYVLGGMLYKSIISIEAVIKYFSLGALSTGFLLLGISIFFGIIGSLDFLEIQIFLGSFKFIVYFLEIKIGLLLLLIGFFFKISAFPFHIWVVDVYEGIWTPITAFFAIVIKVCLILFFLRLTYNVMFNILFTIQPIMCFVSIGSMFIGSLGALKQVRIKRFIAYTSINQVGFLLLGIASSNLMGLISSLIYIILYAIMNIIFFSIILNSVHLITKRNMIYLSDLYCFSIYNNENSKYLVITILSMAGIPPLAGFIGKLFLYFAIIESRLDFILIVSLFISMVSSYYYLSFIRYIFFEKRYNLKLFYCLKQNNINVILKILSSSLIFFLIFLQKILAFNISLALSCCWPLLWY